jgi:endonuclease YncB( thermonuclease family)
VTAGVSSFVVTTRHRLRSFTVSGRSGTLAHGVETLCRGVISSAPNVRQLLFPLLFLLSLPTHADTLTGRVVGVGDGDTITILDANRQQHKIRLGGIDAPEKAQPFGQRSKESLSAMVFNKEVRVDWEKRDKYKRIVGKIWVQPASCPTCQMTLDAGHAQITVGLAWWYRKYSNEQSAQDRGAYEFSEQEARAKRAGLWADVDPVPPWDWRKEARR